jgi:ATP-dependent DNA helicase RecQ
MDDPALPFASPDEALSACFGERTFRPGQREAIDAVLAGHDALVIMPTGAGKSRIYQIAALLLPGTALVVSPLIALMRDQMHDLHGRGYPGAAVLHSQVPAAEQHETLKALRDGRLHLLYLTPERCASEEFLSVARQARISLLAVDEAHSISEWGHDFRPEYQLMDDAARALGRPPLLALTATATPPVREEIIERLGLHRPHLIVRGFDRPNLFYEVYPVADEREKQRRLLELVGTAPPPYPTPLACRLAEASAGRGIVYTALTRTARSLSQALNRAGVHAAYYHGKLKAGQRNAVQARFSDGAVRAIAATNAFGMGVDLPDLRFIYHHDVPASLEGYYQEAGRAGRDGAFARCALLFSREDLSRAAFMSGSGAVSLPDLAQVAQVVSDASSRGMTRTAIAAASGLSASRVVRTLELLVATGAVAERRGRYRPRALDAARVQQALERDESRQARARTKLEMVRAYATVDSCRRQFLLQYFGEFDAPDRCDMCDRCVPRTNGRLIQSETRAPAVESSGPFHAGDPVEHETWGEGVVQHTGGGKVTVHFPTSGYRTLDLITVMESKVLRPA